MREANPRAHLTRLIADRNYLGAQLYLREAELERDERNELLGMLATAVVDELSRTRREDRERVVYLRSVLAWILREVPGLGSMYREQLRGATAGGDVVSQFARGMRTFGDVAAGRTSFSDAADEARHNFEDATERFRSGESSEQVNDFLSSAEKGIRDGLDQLGAFFRAMNEDRESHETTAGDDAQAADHEDEARAAARADSETDVEDAEFAADDEAQDINVERE